MCFLRQCCTHSLCPTLWSQCSKTGSVLACSLCAEVMVACGKSLLHTKQGSHHVFFAAMLHSQFVPHIVATLWGQNCARSWPCRPQFCAEVMVLHCGQIILGHCDTMWGLKHVSFAAMLHSQFVPHIVVTMPQNWLGLGHAAFVQKSWLGHCGKSLLHTKHGVSPCVFCGNAALTVCAPHCGHSPKTGSVLAMQPLCRSHGWTVVNHYYTQDWGLTMCFLQCCTHCHIVFFAAMLHSQKTHCAPHCGHNALQNWLGLGHAAFVQKSCIACGKSLLHTKLGSPMCFCAAMLHSQFVPHIMVTCCKTGSVLAMQPLCRSHGWTVVNHCYTQCGVSNMCFLRHCCTHTHCGQTPKLARLGHAFVQKS